MSNNDDNASQGHNAPQGDNASQWGNASGNPERGPSFQDPAHPASPAPASQQDWDSAWGMNDPQPGGDAPVDGAAPGWGPGGAQNAPPAHTGYASAPQSAPYGGGAPAQGGPYGGQAPQAQYPYPQQYQGQDPYAAQAGGYQQQPYGAYGSYGYAQPAKSKTTAALLAFFLGGLGIHSFYLGKKNLGLIHLGLVGLGLLIMIAGAVAGGMSGDSESPLFALAGLGYMVLIANNIWAFVEFIMILIKPEQELGR